MFTERTADRLARWIGVALLGAGLLLGAEAAAATPAAKLSVADRRAIEDTVRAQLDAFGRDDAEAAFGFATPAIQRMFGSSESFLRMVRDHYEAVYRPTAVRFDRAELVDGDWVQPVQVTDEAGRVWHALFTMQRQTDKHWKVAGCRLVETRAIQT